jgi:GNAT superfamily N-acetyltransferase
MPAKKDVRVQEVDSEDDMAGFYDVARSSFGLQTKDAFWLAMNSGYDTPEGFAANVEKQAKRWRSTHGKGFTYFVKAVVTDEDGVERIGGATIWTEYSTDRNPPAEALDEVMDLEASFPGDETRQRYLRQLFRSFRRRRLEVIKEAGKHGRSIMVLDVCCVRPEYQGMGLARRMVQWGLDLAATRGPDGKGLECFTEASDYGRPVYLKMGFETDSELTYDLDPEFQSLPRAAGTHLFRPLPT